MRLFVWLVLIFVVAFGYTLYTKENMQMPITNQVHKLSQAQLEEVPYNLVGVNGGMLSCVKVGGIIYKPLNTHTWKLLGDHIIVLDKKVPLGNVVDVSDVTSTETVNDASLERMLEMF